MEPSTPTKQIVKQKTKWISVVEEDFDAVASPENIRDRKLLRQQVYLKGW